MAKQNLLQLISFEDKSIRRVWYDGEWYFTIIDVVAVCSDSINPSGYLKDMRRRDAELAKGWGQIATPLKVPTKGGLQTLNCANTRILFNLPIGRIGVTEIINGLVGTGGAVPAMSGQGIDISGQVVRVRCLIPVAVDIGAAPVFLDVGGGR